MKKPLLYQSIANEIAELIESKAFKVGQKVPSVRELSRQRRVSVTTTVQAYSLLEARGVLETRPKSGYFVKAGEATRRKLLEPNHHIPSSVPLRTNQSEFIAQIFRAARDPQYFPFGTATPGPALLPTDKLAALTRSVSRLSGGAALQYEYSPGSLVLREQLAIRSLSWGCHLRPDDFVVTTGALEGLTLALLAVTRPGDTIAIESPSYFGFLQLAEGLGLKTVEISTDPKTGMDISSLASALKKSRIQACLVVTHFHNPLGALMPDEKKRDLVKLLARWNVPLIEDDIYGDLYFGSSRPMPAKAFDRNDSVILCSSVSKTVAPGFRVGWITPGRYRDRIEILKSSVTGLSATLPQLVIGQFMKSGAYDGHLKFLRNKFHSDISTVRDAIQKYFPPGTRVSAPEGGFLLWVELHKDIDTLQLQQRAHQQKISIAPGPIFSARRKFNNCFRLSCGQGWSPSMERALRTLGKCIFQEVECL